MTTDSRTNEPTKAQVEAAARVSMEVLNEYKRIAQWLEGRSVLLGPVGDTMHGLAAEALTNLIEHEYSRHTIPLYGMLDLWMALYGTSHPQFDEFYEKHGYAETWARLLAEVRSRAAAGAAPQAESGHDWMTWDESGKNGTYCRSCGGWAGKVGNRQCSPAPVLPSSGVDEETLANLIHSTSVAHFGGLDPRVAPIIARAVAAWLKRQGGESRDAVDKD